MRGVRRSTSHVTGSPRSRAEPREGNRGLLISRVHVDQSGAIEPLGRTSSAGYRQRGVPLPQHHPFAVRRIDQDQRVAVRSLAVTIADCTSTPRRSSSRLISWP